MVGERIKSITEAGGTEVEKNRRLKLLQNLKALLGMQPDEPVKPDEQAKSKQKLDVPPVPKEVVATRSDEQKDLHELASKVVEEAIAGKVSKKEAAEWVLKLAVEDVDNPAVHKEYAAYYEEIIEVTEVNERKSIVESSARGLAVAVQTDEVVDSRSVGHVVEETAAVLVQQDLDLELVTAFAQNISETRIPYPTAETPEKKLRNFDAALAGSAIDALPTRDAARNLRSAIVSDTPDLSDVKNKFDQFVATVPKSEEPSIVKNLESGTIGVLMGKLPDEQISNIFETFHGMGGGGTGGTASLEYSVPEYVTQANLKDPIYKTVFGNDGDDVPEHSAVQKALYGFIHAPGELREHQEVLRVYQKELQKIINTAPGSPEGLEAQKYFDRIRDLIPQVESSHGKLRYGDTEYKVEETALQEEKVKMRRIIKDNPADPAKPDTSRIDSAMTALSVPEAAIKAKATMDSSDDKKISYIQKVGEFKEMYATGLNEYLSGKLRLFDVFPPSEINNLDRYQIAFQDLQILYPTELGPDGIEMLKDLSSFINQVKREAAGIRDLVIVNWNDFKSWPADNQNPDPPSFPFRHLSEIDVNGFVEKGIEGERQFFRRFLEEKGVMLRQQAQLDLYEQSMMSEFNQYLRWKYGEVDGPLEVAYYRQVLDQWQQIHNLYRVILIEPLDEETLIKRIFGTLTPDQLQQLVNAKFADLTISFHSQALTDLMEQKAERYHNLKHGNASLQILSADQRVARITELKSKILAKSASAQDVNEYTRLLTERNEMNSGVMLWDEDVVYDFDRWQKLSERYAQQREILGELTQQGHASGSAEYAALLQKLEKVALTPTEQEFVLKRGKSTVDRMVSDRLEFYIKNTLHLTEGADYSSLDIDLAVRNAATYHLFTLNTFRVGASMAIAPETGEFKMKAPFGERIVRIFNPGLFQRRFDWAHLPGEGRRASYILQNLDRVNKISPKTIGQLEKTLPSGIKINIKDIYDQKYEELRQKGRRYAENEKKPEGRRDKSVPAAWEKYTLTEVLTAESLVHAAEAYYDIPYTEMLKGDFPKIGGIDQYSTWRSTVGFFHEMTKKLSARPGDFDPTEIAVVYQFFVNPLDLDKKDMMHKMVRRFPLFALNNDPKINNLIQERFGTRVDTRVLKEALTLAQRQIAMDMKDASVNYFGQFVDLGQQQYFNEIVKPILENLGKNGYVHTTAQMQTALGNADPSTLNDYLEAVQLIQKEFTHRIDHQKWAEFEWPIQMIMADADLLFAEFAKQGTYSIQRRSGDIMDSFQASAAVLGLQGDPVLMFPNDPNAVFEKLKEVHNHISSVSGPRQASEFVEDLLVAFIDDNIWKGRNSIGWIPGGGILTRNIKFLRRSNLGSRGLKYSGEASNMYDEVKVYDILRTALDMKLIYEDQKEKLATKFGADKSGLARVFIRRNWWLLPLLFVWISGQLVQEDQKKMGQS